MNTQKSEVIKLIAHATSPRKHVLWAVLISVLLVCCQVTAAEHSSVVSTPTDETELTSLFDGLNFRIQETDSLQIAGRIWNMLLLSYNGNLAPQNPDDAMMTIQPSIMEEEIHDIAAFATQRLMQIDVQNELQIRDIEGEPIEVNGAPGYETIAAATDPLSGIPVVLYQAIVLHGTTYYAVQGFVGANLAEIYVPEFKAVTRSLTFVE